MIGYEMEISTDRYDILCLDVFDTAILRLLDRPTDVFKYMESEYGWRGFAEDRVVREAKTRVSYRHRKDVSIDQIYEQLPYSLDKEIEAEKLFCIANPEIHRIYEASLKAGIKVYFVSDMYLRKEHVVDILTANGYDRFEDVFVSSEDDLIKGDGSRYVWLRDKLALSPGRILHIGDNYVSDYLRARENGIDSIHYSNKESFYSNDQFTKDRILPYQSQGKLGISFLCSAYHYWRLKKKETPSYWRSFGFFYGGPLVTAFCQFINRNISENGYNCKNIYFLARDGRIVLDVYRRLYQTDSLKYLWASRRCMAFPSLSNFEFKSDEDPITQFCTPVGISSASDIVARFNYEDLHHLEKELESHIDFSTVSILKIYECLLRFKALLIERAKNERAVLKEYLHHVGMLDEKEIVLVDVGWGGTIQNCLMKILNEIENMDKRVHGIYIGVSDNAKNKEYKSGFLFENNIDHFRKYLDLIELLTSSSENGIIRILKTGDHFVPERFEACAEERKRQAAAFDIQQGIQDFADIVKERGINPLSFFDAEVFKILFEGLNDHPCTEDMRHLGDLKHCTVLGNKYDKAILPTMRPKGQEARVHTEIPNAAGSDLHRKMGTLFACLRARDYNRIKNAVMRTLRSVR